MTVGVLSVAVTGPRLGEIVRSAWYAVPGRGAEPSAVLMGKVVDVFLTLIIAIQC